MQTLLGPGPAPSRSRIVEVGHLAAARAGEGRRLILLLGPHLAARRFRWVVGTLTEEMRHLFRRMGVDPVALGVADPAVLGAEAAHWGSYYDHLPLVMAGDLQAALAALRRRQGMGAAEAPFSMSPAEAGSIDPRAGSRGHA